MERFSSKDFWAGVLFAGCGTLGLILSAELRIGTARNMGPGYVPRMLGYALIALGVIIALRAIIARAERIEAGDWRPIILITGALAAFVFFFVETRYFPFNGLAAATIALIVLSAWARTGARPLETAATAAVLLALCIGIFKYGLGMTFPIIRGIW